MSGYLLDTHAWLWAQTEDLSRASADFFSQVERWQRKQQAYISAISVLEIARLVADQELELFTSIDEFVDAATRDGGFQIVPLTSRILIESTRLPGEIHRDPADRLLATTVREHAMTLVTRDKHLLAYGRKGHIRTLKL